jgi:hypothetical protein
MGDRGCSSGIQSAYEKSNKRTLLSIRTFTIGVKSKSRVQGAQIEVPSPMPDVSELVFLIA